MKVLMVCLGNICRSPMADGLLRKKVQDHGLNVTVDSAGTAGYHIGEAPDPRMQDTARKFGLDISHLRGRQFSVQDYDNFDLIYAMDEENYRNILRLARDEADKNKVDMILNEIHPGANMSVPDPYYGGDQGFIDVYNMLNEATDKVIAKIQS